MGRRLGRGPLGAGERARIRGRQGKEEAPRATQKRCSDGHFVLPTATLQSMENEHAR